MLWHRSTSAYREVALGVGSASGHECVRRRCGRTTSRTGWVGDELIGSEINHCDTVGITVVDCSPWVVVDRGAGIDGYRVGCQTVVVTLRIHEAGIGFEVGGGWFNIFVVLFSLIS